MKKVLVFFIILSAFLISSIQVHVILAADATQSPASKAGEEKPQDIAADIEKTADEAEKQIDQFGSQLEKIIEMIAKKIEEIMPKIKKIQATLEGLGQKLQKQGQDIVPKPAQTKQEGEK